MGSVPRTAFPSCKRMWRLDAAEDRLSDLPDCLLHDILSHLPSRQAVQTSLLSRRWRQVWRSVPCVDIDQRQFPGSHVPGSRQRGRFEDFADGMLAFASAAPAPLDAFRLHLVDGRSASSERWIRRGLRRHPATVDIHCNLADDRSIVEWPPSHANLRDNGCRLTRLTLSGVTLRYGFVERLDALCPVLQELRIYNCHLQSNCTINSPTLKILAVFCRTRYPYPSTVTLAIAAPRLAALFLLVPFGSTGCNLVITAPGHEALASLVKASICLDDQDRPNKRPNKTKIEFLRSMCGFLARLSNVRNLRLSGFPTTALLDHESQEFPVLQNLTTLLLRCCDVGACNSQVLLRILDSTPNLEKIGLYHCKFSGRLKGRRRKTEPERTSSKQRVKTFLQHKNLSSIELKCQPDDRTHWKEVFGKCSMQQWRIVRNSYSVVRSVCVNIGRGEVSKAARTTPVRELTVGLGRLRITTCEPVATTTRVQRTSKQRRVRRRVTKIAGPPTPTDDVRRTEDDHKNLQEQHKETTC